MNSCTIIQTSQGKNVEETTPYLLNIVKFLHIHLGIKFKELVGDFVKDESGIWWLINIKGFVLFGEPVINQKLITNYGDEDMVANRNGKVIIIRYFLFCFAFR